MQLINGLYKKILCYDVDREISIIQVSALMLFTFFADFSQHKIDEFLSFYFVQCGPPWQQNGIGINAINQLLYLLLNLELTFGSS